MSRLDGRQRQVIVDHRGSNMGVNNAPINRIFMRIFTAALLSLFTSGSMICNLGHFPA